MNTVAEFIESGILEMYVLGTASREEAKQVEEMALSHPEILNEIDAINTALEKFAQKNAITPNPTIRPFLLATIDYSERLKKGEKINLPPTLNENSKIEDYKEWLNRPDMVLPDDFKDIHAKIIGYTPQIISAIVWLKNMVPAEAHDDEFEKFLIVEGTCDITIENKVHQLKPGDYLQIPLHASHNVKITSEIPCKIILQRMAA